MVSEGSNGTVTEQEAIGPCCPEVEFVIDFTERFQTTQCAGQLLLRCSKQMRDLLLSDPNSFSIKVRQYAPTTSAACVLDAIVVVHFASLYSSSVRSLSNGNTCFTRGDRMTM